MSVTVLLEQPREVQHTSSRRKARKVELDDNSDDEPLVDMTAALRLHSKKLARQQKRKEQKVANKSTKVSPLLENLPLELLQHICSYLFPGDILTLRSVDRSIRGFVDTNESFLAKLVIKRRYSILAKCFPLPVTLAEVDSKAHPALLNSRRQQLLAIHKKPYQHIPVIDETQLCTCMACLYAWNNLCLILDYAHWQHNLTNHEPIPMIERGRTPEWNRKLLEKNSRLVLRALDSPLRYAAILHIHLLSINRTILRPGRRDGKPVKLESRLYHLTEAEAKLNTDDYLSRSGPPSYEFPYHRDNYYSLEAYVPNRRWYKTNSWLYYADGQHERDLKWAVERFSSPPTLKREDVKEI